MMVYTTEQIEFGAGQLDEAQHLHATNESCKAPSGVSATSLWIAADRAMETERDHSVFQDVYAKDLAGHIGYSYSSKYVEIMGNFPIVTVRTHYIDQELHRLIGSGTKQVIIMACGMDTRALRLEVSSDVQFFEIDFPSVFEYKEPILKRNPEYCKKPHSNRHIIPADLRTDTWKRQLLEEHGYKPHEKSVWITEGLLMYLEEDQVRAMFDKIRQMVSQGTEAAICGNIFVGELYPGNRYEPLLRWMQEQGASWNFSCHKQSVEEFFEDSGWQVTCLREYFEEAHRIKRISEEEYQRLCSRHKHVPYKRDIEPRMMLFTALLLRN
eukprot:GEZU01013010.1.p1 GENE.GEZU01013010.1~~GEZU01013010.1.p1  ORF type:complete len:325 (+),score=40.95 GEZU01013010.1:138-1112(+)